MLNVVICLFLYFLYVVTLQRSGTRLVTKHLRSMRPERRWTFHTQFWDTAMSLQALETSKGNEYVDWGNNIIFIFTRDQVRWWELLRDKRPVRHLKKIVFVCCRVQHKPFSGDLREVPTEAVSVCICLAILQV